VSFGVNDKEISYPYKSASLRTNVRTDNSSLVSISNRSTLFSIDKVGNTILSGSNPSTSTSTGTLAILGGGGIGIRGNLNVGGNIRLFDGGNTSTIDQSGATLLLTNPIVSATRVIIDASALTIRSTTTSVSGNVIASQPYTPLVISNPSINPVLANSKLHTYIHNNANSIAPKTIIAQSFPLSMPSITTVFVNDSDNLYHIIFNSLGKLQKGTIVDGCVFYSDNPIADCHFGIYAGGTNTTLLASTSSTTSMVSGFNYVNFTSRWVVPSTNVYYFAHGILGSNPRISFLTLPGSPFYQHGYTGSTQGVLNRACMIRLPASATESALPASTSGLTFGLSTFKLWFGLYSQETTGIVPRLALLPNNGTTFVWNNSINILPSSATMFNSPTYNLTTGYTFNGTNHYGTIQNVVGSTDFENTNNYTIEAWINPQEPNGGEGNIIEKWNSANQLRYPYVMRYIKSGSFVRMAAYDGTNNPTVDISVNTGVWHHMVGVFNFSTKTLTGYRNGVQMAAVSLASISSSISNTSLVGIGNRIEPSGTPATTLWYKGSIGLVRIYNYSLNTDEISAIYNQYINVFV
jgi:hypothetical protein